MVSEATRDHAHSIAERWDGASCCDACRWEILSAQDTLNLAASVASAREAATEVEERGAYQGKGYFDDGPTAWERMLAALRGGGR